MLEQTVMSYLQEGWPHDQIVVVDNTGHAIENMQGLSMTVDAHFLNYTRLRTVYGVAVYSATTSLSLAQFQNLLLFRAQREGIADYYWSHQDVVVRSRPELFLSVFEAILAEKRSLLQKFGHHSSQWAVGFYDYDRLAHFNTLNAHTVGDWDVFIPFYPADCDYYGRARRANRFIYDFPRAYVYDVAQCLNDVSHLCPQASPEHVDLDSLLQKMSDEKEHSGKRNSWHKNDDVVDVANGISPDFGRGFSMQIEAGRKWYKLKWKTNSCNIA